MDIDKVSLYLLVLLVIVLVFLLYFYYYKPTKEHFTAEESYDSRMTVMKVFEMVLDRKPTPDEIEKYSSYKNEQDILLQILQDFNETSKTSSDVTIEKKETFDLNTPMLDKEQVMKQIDTVSKELNVLKDMVSTLNFQKETQDIINEKV